MWETVDVSEEKCPHGPHTVMIKHEKEPIYGKNLYRVGYEYQSSCLSALRDSPVCLLCEKYLRRHCESELGDDKRKRT
jgi:hypothetical protein